MSLNENKCSSAYSETCLLFFGTGVSFDVVHFSVPPTPEIVAQGVNDAVSDPRFVSCAQLSMLAKYAVMTYHASESI
jgi:hypothetical protein